jgi:hypothetical protein
VVVRLVEEESLVDEFFYCKCCCKVTVETSHSYGFASPESDNPRRATNRSLLYYILVEGICRYLRVSLPKQSRCISYRCSPPGANAVFRDYGTGSSKDDRLMRSILVSIRDALFDTFLCSV